ncbi:nose resistant to fluoxetine protein 6-like isoform X2 [Dermacentor albipictus]|uniref:nose resistant to fluoxetine protein 6-like isoform X2 n=1 Tax=Dermacentor albipictus TaxID=60249 RepID=UPI0038FBFC95
MNLIGSNRLPLLGYMVAHFIASSECVDDTTTTVAGAPIDSEASTRSFEADVDDALTLLSRKALPLVSELLTSGEVGAACSSSLIKLFLHLRLKEPWAIRMVTANGLVPTNLLEGSLVSLGGYEQCLKTRFHDYQGELLFKGRYCSLFAQMPKEAMRSLVERFHAAGMLRGRKDPLTATTDTGFHSIDFRVGICLPSLCSHSEIDYLFSSIMKLYGVNATVRGCRTDDPKSLTILQACSIALFCSLALLLCAGTIAEWYVKPLGHTKPSKKAAFPFKFLCWFSVISNTQRLFNASQYKGTPRENLLFFSGAKLILCFWVVFFHSYTLIQPEFYHSGFKIFDMGDRVYFQLITNAFLSISSLFFIQGFTFSYLVNVGHEALPATKCLRSYLLILVHRYIRLTVPVVIVVFFAFLLPTMGEGPADQELFSKQIGRCAEKWWTVITHTNNFNALNETCLVHLWYVSTEMQLFTLTLPFTMLLPRFPKTTVTVLLLTGVTCSTYTAFRTFFTNLLYGMTTGTNDGRRIFKTIELIYFRPITHVATYVSGILAGYLAVRYKEVTISGITQALLWLMSAAVMSFILFITLPWNRGHLPDPITNAIYGGYHRLLWSLSLCWPAYACATGCGANLAGMIARMSSWKGFVPLARLTQGVYLLQGVFLLLRMALVKTRFNLDDFFQLTNTLGIIGISYCFAYLLFLLCDAPIENVYEHIFGNKVPETSQPTMSTPRPLQTSDQIRRLP